MRKIYGNVKDLQNKPAHRLRNIREADRQLFYTSHNGGAGGIAECDRLLGEN